MQRIILDSSFPEDYSVNTGIDGDYYLGEEYYIHLPTISLMENRVLEQCKGCYLYKTDLARGYRQLRVYLLD